MGGLRLRYLILDLDDTLYPRRSGLMDLISERIGRYMVERLGFPPAEAEALRQRYYTQYGTTLRGLMEEHSIDPEDYLAYVHDVPLEAYIQPNPALDRMLGRIPLTKVIFTNASEEHARRVIERLGIAHHFPIILDVRRLEYYNKPDPEAYRRILQHLRAQGPECIFVDDSARNLRPARALGMITILVDDQTEDGVDFHVPDILSIEPVIRRLLLERNGDVKNDFA
ncbi:pyrimidine 5'-nucleotidase [Thermoflexus sp.]|uniref:pyrimidine 5'-nucleotidase n=1 Tax=Thermoflexus sp. TaxID=1969742 RepID=UPI0035E427F1